MIRMSEQKDLSGDKATSGGGFNINPIDIVMYLLSNWYWFILSVSLFGGYAWYQYAKLPFIYSRSATVMIKDAYSNNIGRGWTVLTPIHIPMYPMRSCNSNHTNSCAMW